MLEMSTSRYITHLCDHLNDPLCVDILLRPWGFSYNSKVSDTLLLGHVIDALALEDNYHTQVDPLDVVTLAWELGLDSAESFLEDGPRIMWSMAHGF